MAVGVVVGFVSQKGGVGKSTLARALGAVIAAGEFKVRIADLDPYQQTVVEWERLRTRSGAQSAIVVEPFKTAAAALATARPDELLLVDAPAHATRATLEIAEASALIVQPTTGALDDLRPAVLLFHELVAAGVPKGRLVMALCRILSRAEEEMARDYIAKAGYAVLPGSVPERSAYRQAHNRGHAITEGGHAAANASVDVLMKALIRLVSGQVERHAGSKRSGSRKKA